MCKDRSCERIRSSLQYFIYHDVLKMSFNLPCLKKFVENNCIFFFSIFKNKKIRKKNFSENSTAFRCVGNFLLFLIFNSEFQKISKVY